MPEVTRVMVSIRIPRGESDYSLVEKIADEKNWRLDSRDKPHQAIISVMILFASRRAALLEGERQVISALEGVILFSLEEVGVAQSNRNSQRVYKAFWKTESTTKHQRRDKYLKKLGLLDADLKLFRNPNVHIDSDILKLDRNSVATQAGWNPERMGIRQAFTPKKEPSWLSEVPLTPWWRSKDGALTYACFVCVSISTSWLAVNLLSWPWVTFGLLLSFALSLKASNPLRKAWNQKWATAFLGALIFVTLGAATAYRIGNFKNEFIGLGGAGALAALLTGSFFALSVDTVRRASKVFFTGFLSLIVLSPWTPGILWGVYADRLGVPENSLTVTTSMRLGVIYIPALTLLGSFIIVFSLAGWAHYFRVLPFVGDAWMRVLSAMTALIVGLSLAVGVASNAISSALNAPDQAFQTALKGQEPSSFAGLNLQWVCLEPTSADTTTHPKNPQFAHPLLLIPTQDSRIWTWDLSKAHWEKKRLTGGVLENRPASAISFTSVASGKDKCP